MRRVVLRQLLRRYNRLLHTRPILTNSVTSAFLTALGDIGCQVLWDDSDYNSLRTVRMVLYRICFWGPLYTSIVLGLDRVFGKTASASTALKKLVVDQLLWTTPSNCFFLTW